MGRVAAYIRVSTAEQAKSGLSLPDQRRQLIGWCEKERHELVEVVADKGITGKIRERAGIERLYELVETDRVDIVAVTRRDRLFRRRLWRLLMEEDFEEHGAQIVAFDDTGNRFGDAMLDEIAEDESDRIAWRMRRGKLELTRQGHLLAGKAKYGYRYTANRKFFEVDESQMAVVRRIYRSVAGGMTINATARDLTKDNVPTPGKARKWSAQTVRELLLSDHYTPYTVKELAHEGVPEDVLERIDQDKLYGLWHYNVREHSKKGVRIRPEDEWIAVPIPASGMNRQLVGRARKAIQENRQIANKGIRVWELAGGIARCGKCGYTLTLQSTRKGQSIYFYYICQSAYKRGKDVCSGRVNLFADRVEQRVWKAVSEILRDPENLRRGFDELITEQERQVTLRKTTAVIEKLAARDLEIDAKRIRYQHSFAEDVITLEDLRDRLRELDSEKAQIAEEIRHLRREDRAADDLRAMRDRTLEGYAAASERLDELDAEERNQLYRILGIRIKMWGLEDGSRIVLEGPLVEAAEAGKKGHFAPVHAVSGGFGSISVVLTILGYIPGIIHAVWIIARRG